MKNLFLYFLLIVSFLACSTNTELETYKVQGRTMGTTYGIKIIKNIESFEQYNLIKPKIDSILTEVNRQMSTYIPTSEISKFNDHKDTTWFPISEDFAEVTQSALEICELTNGALDITIGSVVNLWGFGPEHNFTNVPSEKKITERLEKTGYEFVKVHSKRNQIKKLHPEIYLDLSSIAKGFGVDKVADYLEELGFTDYLVEIGGEVRAKGQNHLGNIWLIGIQTPNSLYGVQKAVQVENTSMATSGDYFNYFEKDGIRFSHTIDPRTGRPITHKLASVTVIHESCMKADALATALNVMGPERGMELAEKMKLPVFMIVRKDKEFIEKMTIEFDEILKNKK